VRVFEHKISFAKNPPLVRQSYPSPTVNFGSGSQCSSHYLKAHGFLETPGSSARVESSISRKSFPGVRAIFPMRDADAGNLGMLFGAKMCIALAE